MLSMTEELELVKRVEEDLILIQDFIRRERQRTFEEVPMTDLFNVLASIDEKMIQLSEQTSVREAGTDDAKLKQLQVKRSEVNALFGQIIGEFESWREAALAEGQTVNLKVKAGRSYNQMKPL